MNKYCAVFFIAFTVLAVSQQAAAQKESETVNKVISKNLSCSSRDILSIYAEKAAITVTGWKNNYIQLRISFSATHTDKKIASRELEFMQYSLTREKNTIELRNAFILPSSADNIQSKLEVLIELMMPFHNQLSVQNKYGNADIGNLSGKINVNIAFSDISFHELTGNIVLQSSYSEIRSHGLNPSSFRCQDEKSRFFMELDAGSYTFNCKHSELDLAIKNISALKVESSRTDITIRPERFDSYHYKLVNKEGTIYMPGQYSQRVKKEGKQNSFLMTGTPAKPFIQLATTFNTITIK